MKNVKAIILAAGRGTRMKSELPKVLHPVGSCTMLEKVIGSLKKAGIDDITAVIGYGADLIREKLQGQGIRFVEQKELLGSGDAVKCAVKEMGGLSGDVIVTCGDTPLITVSAYKGLTEARRKNEAACAVLTCEVKDPYAYGRIIRDEQGRLLKIVEEKDATETEKTVREVNVGTYCFNGSDLEEHIHGISVNEKKKEFYLTDIVEILSAEGGRIASGSCAEEEMTGVNSRKDLAEVNKTMNLKTISRLMDSGVTVVDPENTHIDDNTDIGKDTIIFPHTVIEGDVKIGSNCRIGPFARIRPGSVIADNVEIGNFVEVNRTEIGEGTMVKHHTYLGDAVLGKKVNIGAGTITANYDGVNKHKTIIKDQAFIGVGARLIAPVEIGKNAKVGAGSVVTKNKNVPDNAVVAGVPARPFEKKA